MAITPQDVITWGSNEHGQCGHGEKAETDWVKPRSIKMLHEAMVTQVVCGRHHTLCVTATSQARGATNTGRHCSLGSIALLLRCELTLAPPPPTHLAPPGLCLGRQCKRAAGPG